MEILSEKNQRGLLVDTQEEECPPLSPWLLKLIVKDDAGGLEEALEAMAPSTRMAFLAGQEAGLKTGLYKHQTDSFACLGNHQKTSLERQPDFSIDSTPRSQGMCNLQLHKPWILAGAYGSAKVIKSMLGYGVDVLQRDSCGYNIIHALILVAHLQYRKEFKCDETLRLLKSLLDVDTYKELLLTEDNLERLRPLEMASHFGTFLLFRTVFETKGVYLAKEITTGIYKTQWFDITEYESDKAGNRRGKSPLLTLTCIDKSRVPCPKVRKMLLASPTGTILRKWIEAKMTINKPMIVFWFILRLVYIFMFFSATRLGEDVANRNGTSFISFLLKNANISDTNSSKYTDYMVAPALDQESNDIEVDTRDVKKPLVFTIFAYLLIHSIMIIITDVYEFYIYTRGRLSWLGRTPAGPKKVAVHFKTYRVAQFTLAISVTFVVILIGLIVAQGKVIVLPRYVDHLFLIHAMYCIVVSLKYFLQATKCIGPFIISFERMLKHLVCFTAVFFFFVIPYTIVFRHIICDDPNETLCRSNFQTWTDSMYSVFTLTLNMINFGDFHSKNKVELYLMHVQYVFVIIMLLLNFLIAHFTRSVSQIMDSCHVIMPIQRLSLAWSIELRSQHLLPGLYRKLRKRHFVTVGERLFISRTLVAYSDADMQEENLSTWSNVSI